jgi:hypothetical protein
MGMIRKRKLATPGAKHGVAWNGGDALALDADELAFVKAAERILDAAFREADVLGYVSQGNLHYGTPLTMRYPPKEEVDEKSGGLAIMPDQPAHQRIKDVDIDLKHRHKSYGNRCYSR